MTRNRGATFVRTAARRQHALGWAFLLVSINGAAYTLTAYRPPRRNRALFGWSFFASWITIELAPYHLLWQIVATGLFSGGGALRTRPGRVGLAVTLASWAGLAASIRRSVAARHEIRAALRDLPDGDEPAAALPVHVERNLVFGRAGGRNLRLDVHAPAEAPAPGTPAGRRSSRSTVADGSWASRTVRVSS